jgi:EmrB/QacA subfamily drug resistance transporter
VTATGDEPAGAIRYSSSRGRWVLAASVLGSGMAFLDATVVNIALPHIGRDFDAELSGLQWTVNAYTLALAALLLTAGSLGDQLGRRRVFVIGIVWFAVASLACALAPTIELLILARVLQGVGAALLTPTSLALVQASFRPEDRSAAIGAWSGLTGVAGALGPLLGGWLVDVASWRLIFLINLPLAAVVVWAAVRHVPESRAMEPSEGLDVRGASMAALALAGITYGLTAGPGAGWGAAALLPLAVGAAAATAFVVHEARCPHPLVPLSLFRSRVFSAANAVTLAVYAALSALLFLLPLQLQQVAGYTALEAGLALAPVTGLMLLFSPSAGRLCQRIGPRLPLTVGPLVSGAGLALMARIGAGDEYLVDTLPPVLIFGAGLTLTVAPLTAAVLGAAPGSRAGIASAVNTAVARAAGLIAVAVIPVAAGIGASDYLDADAFSGGYTTGMLISAGLCAFGGVLAALTIRPEAREAVPV